MFPTMADVVRVVAADDPLRALFSPAGELTAEGRSRLGLDAAALRELYRNMVLIRRADQEALNLAGVFKAPVVFLCQNNGWAISVPLSKQTAGSIADRASGYGFPGIRIDGNDVLGVYAAVMAAADRARQGEGPYLIEAVTYRMGAHTSSDDPTRYRTESELEAWNGKDPIARYRAWLEQQGIVDERTVAAIADAAESAAQAMRARLTAMPSPPAGGASFGRAPAAPPESFLREREEFESSLEGS